MAKRQRNPASKPTTPATANTAPDNAPAPSPAAAAPHGTAAPSAPFDMDELKARMADYVCGRGEKLTWMQAYVGMSLLKRGRAGRPASAPDADEKPKKISLRWKRPDGA